MRAFCATPRARSVPSNVSDVARSGPASSPSETPTPPTRSSLPGGTQVDRAAELQEPVGRRHEGARLSEERAKHRGRRPRPRDTLSRRVAPSTQPAALSTLDSEWPIGKPRKGRPHDGSWTGKALMLNAAIVGLGRWGQHLVNSVQGKSE